MFETVQEPMMEAAQQSQQNLNSGSNSNTTTTTAPTAPVNSALPNPWGGAGPATNNPPRASNPFAGLGAMGGMGGFGNMGMGGMGGMGGDPAQAMAMLQNPFMQQMMQQMMQNPAMLDQLAAQDPMLAQALQNPQTRAMFTNPDFLRRMSDPATMQAMMQMQQSMRTLQQAGIMPPMGGGLGAMGAFGGFPPHAGGAAGGGGLDFSALLSGGNSNSSSSVPVQDPSERYAAQLQQLQDMGFSDRAANLRALQATSGNVNAAVERLLSGI
jgi:ubiquilin